MIEVSKQLIDMCVKALLQASENYGGTATQFARKYGMSASVWSEIKNGRTEGKLSAQKWLEHCIHSGCTGEQTPLEDGTYRGFQCN